MITTCRTCWDEYWGNKRDMAAYKTPASDNRDFYWLYKKPENLEPPISFETCYIHSEEFRKARPQ